MCVSGYPTVPKFWLPTLKFLEQQKYSFNLSEIFFVFRSSNHCYTALARSRVPCEYIQQIQLLTPISQRKCESNKTQQNGNENGECYTMLWDHHASPTFLFLSAITGVKLAACSAACSKHFSGAFLIAYSSYYLTTKHNVNLSKTKQILTITQITPGSSFVFSIAYFFKVSPSAPPWSLLPDKVVPLL